MKLIQVAAGILILFTLTAFKAEKEKFIGELKLRTCRAEIPLYYSTKRLEALIKAAKEFENVEIVLVTKEKKGLASYLFCYIELIENPKGSIAILVTSENHFYRGPVRSAFFIDYKPRKHTFYRADCFREKLKEHEELNKTLKERKIEKNTR